MITVIGNNSAYYEEPDFWSTVDYHRSKGFSTHDSRGLRSQKSRAIKMVEDSGITMRTSWQFKKDSRSDDYFGLLERRFNRSSKMHRLAPYLNAVTRCKEASESDEDAYWFAREFV